MNARGAPLDSGALRVPAPGANEADSAAARTRTWTGMGARRLQAPRPAAAREFREVPRRAEAAPRSGGRAAAPVVKSTARYTFTRRHFPRHGDAHPGSGGTRWPAATHVVAHRPELA